MCRPVYSLLGSPSMRKLVIAALILFPVVAVGWQVGSAEVSNYEFHDDLGYIAAQSRVNIGLQSPETDDQVRNDVIASAAEDGIRLRPDQVQVKRVTITFPRNPPLTHYDVAQCPSIFSCTRFISTSIRPSPNGVAGHLSTRTIFTVYVSPSAFGDYSRKPSSRTHPKSLKTFERKISTREKFRFSTFAALSLLKRV